MALYLNQHKVVMILFTRLHGTLHINILWSCPVDGYMLLCCVSVFCMLSWHCVSLMVAHTMIITVGASQRVNCMHFAVITFELFLCFSNSNEIDFMDAFSEQLQYILTNFCVKFNTPTLKHLSPLSLWLLTLAVDCILHELKAFVTTAVPGPERKPSWRLEK